MNNDINNVLTWKPKKEYKSGIGMSQFHFVIGIKKMPGTVSYIVGEDESYLEFPWMNKYEKIDTAYENKYKELVFKIMQQDSFEKLEILKAFN